MGTLKTWLGEDENRKKASSGNNLIVLLNDLDSHTVGIRGNNVFPITYSLVANVGVLNNIFFLSSAKHSTNKIDGCKLM